MPLLPDPDPAPLSEDNLITLYRTVQHLQRQVRWLTVVANVAFGLALLTFALLVMTTRDLGAHGLLHW